MAQFGTTLTDLGRNINDAERVRNDRAIAAMQLLASMNQTGAVRSGQSSAERIASKSAANEAERIRNTLLLGQETNTNAATIAKLERDSRFELGQLPYSPEARKHALEIARLGIRPDPYMTRDIGKANIESLAINDLAKSIAESANLTIDREEAELLKDLPGWDKWDRDTKIKDGLTKIITRLDEKLGENRQLLEFVPSTNRYKPRVRAIIPIPTGQEGGPPQTGLPLVPPIQGPRQNWRMMDESIPLPAPLPMSGVYNSPTGGVAVPVAARAAAPAMAVPQGGMNPYINNLSRSMDFAGPMMVPARAAIDAATYLPRQVYGSQQAADILQKLKSLGMGLFNGR